jgi:hypothetical protein
MRPHNNPVQLESLGVWLHSFLRGFTTAEYYSDRNSRAKGVAEWFSTITQTLLGTADKRRFQDSSNNADASRNGR